MGKSSFLISYLQPRKPGSFTGLGKFKRTTRQSLKKTRKELAKLDAYIRHKPATKRFPRRKTVVSGPDAQWQIDLIDTSPLSQIQQWRKVPIDLC